MLRVSLSRSDSWGQAVTGLGETLGPPKPLISQLKLPQPARAHTLEFSGLIFLVLISGSLDTKRLHHSILLICEEEEEEEDHWGMGSSSLYVPGTTQTLSSTSASGTQVDLYWDLEYRGARPLPRSPKLQSSMITE